MFTLSRIFLLLAIALLLASAIWAYQAIGTRAYNIPIWPVAVVFTLAVALLGAAVLTA